jgi:proline racemase
MPLLHNIALYNSEGEPELVSIDVDYSNNGFKVIVNACTVITEIKSMPSDEIVDIQTGIARALNYLDEDDNPELWRVVMECEIDHKANGEVAELEYAKETRISTRWGSGGY